MDRADPLTVLNTARHRYGLRANKRFGQNFLIDEEVLSGILDAAGITGKDYVIEIGPGIGTMTERLCEAADFVTAVEIDQKLIPILTDRLSHIRNLEILNQDILKTDLDAMINEKKTGEGECRIVANLPYYITTPVIMQLLEARHGIADITVMVQKEVADRICAGPAGKDYGAISLAAQYYAVPRIMMTVPPSAFFPEPAVTSAVLKLSVRQEPPVSVENEKQLFSLIKASFSQRRKTLVNGLKNASELNFSKEKIEQALILLGKPLTVRGEELTLSEFAKLSDLL